MPGKPKSPKRFFASMKIRPIKSLGQNFLLDEIALQKIVTAAQLSPLDDVLEIGAGLGALTRLLGEGASSVVAVERDSKLIPGLKTAVSGLPNVTVVHGDALDMDFKQFSCGQKLKVVSNLPYSVSSQIIMSLLERRGLFSLLVLMVQRELAQRITARPGGRDIGAISVLIQVYMDCSALFNVPPGAFWPEPGVESTVIKLMPLETPKIPESLQKQFASIVKACYSQRRKMIANSLRSILSRDETQRVLEAASIDPKRRPETLSVEEFGILAEAAAQIEHAP
ncbi:MAG: 16S rRNA (adenine(1518)-N(6)/adenine(1519)-N(6))-dimethyltransferase RsmA [Thermodesulfobacteriota bacterium]